MTREAARDRPPRAGLASRAGPAFHIPRKRGGEILQLIPFPRPLYSYSWVVGLLTAIVVYYGLGVLFPARGRLGEPAVSGGATT
jgi:cytosine/uracil/thiamine/allantoin permease